MASSEGSREIDVAKKRLAAAEARAAADATAVQAAKAMAEVAQSNAQASEQEVQEARKCLKEAEARWEVVAIDDDSDAEESESANTENKKRFCDGGVWGTYDGELTETSYRHGKGKMNWDDGESYEGQWKNNLREGQGLFRHANGDEYEGQFKGGNYEGQGTYRWSYGNVYVGQWKNDEKDRGTYYWKGGEVEIGKYKNDLPSGEGVRWSKSRKTAWLTKEGEKERKISLKKAKEMATRMGFDGVPPALKE